MTTTEDRLNPEVIVSRSGTRHLTNVQTKPIGSRVATWCGFHTRPDEDPGYVVTDCAFCLAELEAARQRAAAEQEKLDAKRAEGETGAAT